MTTHHKLKLVLLVILLISAILYAIINTLHAKTLYDEWTLKKKLFKETPTDKQLIDYGNSKIFYSWVRTAFMWIFSIYAAENIYVHINSEMKNGNKPPITMLA